MLHTSIGGCVANSSPVHKTSGQKIRHAHEQVIPIYTFNPLLGFFFFFNWSFFIFSVSGEAVISPEETRLGDDDSCAIQAGSVPLTSCQCACCQR